MSIDKVINSQINLFELLKNNNNLVYLECYNHKKITILSLLCKLEYIIRDGYWLISHLSVYKIRYKDAFYNEIKIGSIIKIRKFIFDIIKILDYNHHHDLNHLL